MTERSQNNVSCASAVYQRLVSKADDSPAVQDILRYIENNYVCWPDVDDWTTALQAVPELVVRCRVPCPDPSKSALVIDYQWVNGLEWRTTTREDSGSKQTFRHPLHGALESDGGRLSLISNAESYFATPIQAAGTAGGPPLRADGGQPDKDDVLNTREEVFNAIEAHRDGTNGAPVGDVLETVLSETDAGIQQVCLTIRNMHATGDIYQPTDSTLKRVHADGGTSENQEVPR